MAQVQEKKGGPYTKNEKMKRQNEVYKLHFEHGYSAVKISDMMRINRNTINSDINYWYSSLSKEWNSYDIECRGSEVTITLNGLPVIWTDLADFTTPIGKFDTPLAQLPHTGHIILQDHGDEVWFRNLTVEPL